MMEERTRASFGLWFRAAGIVLVATALVTFFAGFFSRKFHLQTGPAQWIWIDHDATERSPIAFFAVRDVEIPPDPPIVRLRIACDADWTLYLNGQALGGGRDAAQPSLNTFDLAARVRKGETNTIMVALRSADGVGGMLASLDYAPLRENDVATDSSWSVCRNWIAPAGPSQSDCEEKPVLLGPPPVGRWNYPAPSEGMLYPDAARIATPVTAVEDATISRREIRVISGIAVESLEQLPAKLYDFGVIEGRGRITLPARATNVRLIEVRYASDRNAVEAPGVNEAFIFAPGEITLTSPVARRFRYMAVAAPEAGAAVEEWPLGTGSTLLK